METMYAQYSEPQFAPPVPDYIGDTPSFTSPDMSYNGYNNYNGYPQGQPQLGATFVPGGMDDYYMPAPAPELVAPAPQRPIPEVEHQIQGGLASLELDANDSQRYPPQTPATPYGQTPAPYQQFPPQQHYPQNGYQQNTYHNDSAAHNSYHQPIQSPQMTPQTSHPATFGATGTNHLSYASLAPKSVGPTFSPFPKVQNPGPNVPPSDDEKEAMLENAREPVLHSNDPEVQLEWASDALTYVENAQLYEQRISANQPARPATPQAEHDLRVHATNIVQFLADQHHPRAEFIKGNWLEFGKFGWRQDKKEAFRCYSRAAERGYARAEYRIGTLYEQSNDPMNALNHYKRGAAAGDSASNYRIGMMTLLGQHGQKQDFAQGVQLIRQAAKDADNNAPQGAYVLGMLQARDLPQVQVPEIFLPYDEKAARANIEKAAFLGFARAQLKMGAAYELCSLGCEFDPVLSLHYNALAARQGEPEAEMAISKWFLVGHEPYFQKNEEIAYTYAQRAAQAGLATALFAMGYFHEIGVHVPISLEKAIEWYTKAAKEGNEDAQKRLDEVTKSKTLSRRDHENIAVARIKSQHGSLRGKRPERLRAAATPLPTIQDAPVSFPDPSSPTNYPPNRAATSTPYPISDNPPVVAPIERPATVAPYPHEDIQPMHAQRPGPGPGHGPAGGFFDPTMRAASVAPPSTRPTSAFSLNVGGPGPRPGTVAPGGRPGPAPDRYPGGNGPAPPRPYTSVDNMGPGRGRMPPAPRTSSGPAAPQNYRQPGGPGAEKPEKPTAPGEPPKPEAPKLDIGFSAPPDNTRNKLHKAQTPVTGKPPADMGFSAPQDNRPPRTQTPMSGHAAGTLPSQQRPSQGQPRPGSSGRPSRHDTPNYTQPPKPAPEQRPPPPAKNDPPPPAQAQKPAVPSPAAAPQRPPGKGPKTFEEMGIPAGKKEGNCVVM